MSFFHGLYVFVKLLTNYFLEKEQHQVVELETKIEHDNGDEIYEEPGDDNGRTPPNFNDEERYEIIHKHDVPPKASDTK